ncbi:Rossmann-like and DUF2520 domain-containing protein [Rubritalea marina]|uniref:Rossmann-like and DUF2520 domain-containing protein n=1 Tax=Rubritalea marina TaxID=361055 RepID=UPI00036C9C97|nr:Rossmann-like and DUF2520 domain-containing protein [Rubritalea marina]
MDRLNIIGAGNVAQSLARQWHAASLLEIGDIYHRPQSQRGEQALQHIGSGALTSDMRSMQAAKLWMIATPDDQIAAVAQQLAHSKVLRANDSVFHLSGALDSSELEALSPLGVQLSSVHPMMTFQAPLDQNFANTYCAIEGQDSERLSNAFHAIGFEAIPIAREHKVLYHLAGVMACNYLTTLAATSSSLLKQCDIEAKQHMQILGPIMQATLNNLMQGSPSSALTGPIARGDHDTVAKHLESLQLLAPSLLPLYHILAKATLPISQSQGTASPSQLIAIESLLDRD